MSNTLRLISGELKRLISYKLLARSLATAFIWMIVFLFMSKSDSRNIAPLFMFVDTCIVSIMLIGASFYFEQQGSTIKSMMVMPVSIGQILISKIVASLALGLVLVTITCAALFFIHGITFNYALLLLFVLLAVAVHASIGFFLALYSKGLTTMLVMLVAYMLIFVVPTILLAFHVIDTQYEWVVMISPSHTASKLLSSVVSGSFDIHKVLLGSFYLPVLSAVLLRFVVLPKFKSRAVQGGN
ncbi:hypothetical protein A7X67_16160 [Clostridium sp. W14A]|nr:hypothetical protein A7X67_16160 [Clostridium sp. W14A]